MSPLSVSHYSLVSAIGHGREATLAALRSRRSGLRPCDFLDDHLETYMGRVEGMEQSPIVGDLAHFDCHNHRLAAMALRADGFAERSAVILGTSTSGILESELAHHRRSPDGGRLPGHFNDRDVQDTFSVAASTRHFLALRGPVSPEFIDHVVLHGTGTVAAGLSLEARLIPGTLQSRSIDSALGCPVLLENRSASVRCVLSNSFGFGTHSASLIFSRVT